MRANVASLAPSRVPDGHTPALQRGRLVDNSVGGLASAPKNNPAVTRGYLWLGN